MELNKYMLKDEIVLTKSSFLRQEVDLEDPKILDISEKFDTSQMAAFKHALSNSLAIIQGPPG